MEIRDNVVNRIIWNAVMTKAVAIPLNPITVVDILSGAVIDVVMILTLSKVYGIAMTEAGAVELLQKIAISMGGITAGELLANFGLSSLKGLLGLATPATGGLALRALFVCGGDASCDRGGFFLTESVKLLRLIWLMVLLGEMMNQRLR